MGFDFALPFAGTIHLLKCGGTGHRPVPSGNLPDKARLCDTV
jgi:hypothetical protein